VVLTPVIYRGQVMYIKVQYSSEGHLLIADWFMNFQDQLERQALLV